jgi:hypothetical protein
VPTYLQRARVRRSARGHWECYRSTLSNQLLQRRGLMVAFGQRPRNVRKDIKPELKVRMTFNPTRSVRRIRRRFLRRRF